MSGLILPDSVRRPSHELIDGQFVNTKVAQIVQAIKEYEPEIEVKWVPPALRERGRAAYQIWHMPKNGEPYEMMSVRRDEDFDERVLQRIIANDQRNGKVSLSEYESWEEANRLVERQRYNDLMEEAHDIAAHVLRTHKNVYKVDDKITIRDTGGIL